MLRLYHAPFIQTHRRLKQMLQSQQRGTIYVWQLGWFHPTTRA
jgi:hypothetical protein